MTTGPGQVVNALAWPWASNHSITGSGAGGLDVVGPWVSGGSMAETTGVPGGLAGGGGRAGMARRVTSPRTGEPEDAVIDYSYI